MWAQVRETEELAPANSELTIASSPHHGDDIAARLLAVVAENDVRRLVELQAVTRPEFVPRRALHNGEAVAQHPDHLMDQMIGTGGKADFLPGRQFDLDQFQ